MPSLSKARRGSDVALSETDSRKGSLATFRKRRVSSRTPDAQLPSGFPESTSQGIAFLPPPVYHTLMDCPACSLANPPGSARCDCGYDFIASHAPDVPGWPIELSWGQKIAVFWSLSWPAFLVMWLFGMIAGWWLPPTPPRPTRGPSPWISLLGTGVFFAVQAVLTHRLVRKNYRSFRVAVLRETGERTRRVSTREALAIWLWIAGPQVALILTGGVLVSFYRSPDLAKTIDALYLWLCFLLVGPYAVGLALRARYSRFKLQPLAVRHA